MIGKESLSATNLAAYHHFNCDLFIYNTYNGVEGLTISSDHVHESPTKLDAAQFKRGLDWEKHLFSWLDRENLLLTVPSYPMNVEDLVENILADERNHFFVAGISFMPPQEHFDEMYRKAGLEPVKFGLAKPDLVEITHLEDGVMWKVIDAKASRAVKTSHHVQIYFYTLCLSLLLPQYFFHTNNAAAVWLPPEDGFDTNTPSFDDLKTVVTSLLSFPLDEFLFRRLPTILSHPRKEVFWHYNALCHGCPFSKDCKQKAIRQGQIGSMSNISIPEAKLLRSLLQIWRDSGISHPRGETDIEDLALLLEDGKGLQKISTSYPVTLRKAKRILTLPPRNRKVSKTAAPPSPILQAARTGEIQVIPRRNSTCPKIEDIAVVLSLLLDPSASSGTSSIVSFSISIFTTETISVEIPRIVHSDRTDLIPSLAYIIDSILSLSRSLNKPPRTQFYVFSPAEHSALQNHFIDAALNSAYPTQDIRICIGALSQGASLLQTTFQPILLSGVLLDFLAKGQRKKRDLQAILERMNLSIEGNVEELKRRIQEELQRLQRDDYRQAAQQQRRDELGQLPRIVVLKSEIEKSLALPIPGFWNLQECASILLSPNLREAQCPSDEELYDVFASGGSPSALLEQRNRSIYAVLVSLRSHVCNVNDHLLLNEAKVLTSIFMDVCREERLRKLFYMQQFEVLAKLSDLWRSRIDGCPEAPILQYHSTQQGSKRLEHTFYLLSGNLDMAASEKERSFFDYLLVEDRDCDDFESDAHTPVEALFDDLAVSGLVFPLNRYTKTRWQSQNPTVQEELLLADVRDISVQGIRTKVVLQTWGDATFKFSEEHTYRISPRLVDFNISKILNALFELDLQHELENVWVPYIQIIRNPKSFNQEIISSTTRKMLGKAGSDMQSLFRTLDGLDVEGAKPLVLKASQNRAALHILSNRLSVIWGPPGTGKTHTIALSLLRLFNVYANASSQPDLDILPPKVVFVTAVTHAAIDAVLKKLTYLIQCYQSIDSLPAEWLHKVSIEHVTNGNDHAAPSDSSVFSLYAGTIFQLYNFSKRHSLSVDCIVIDEAGQLALSSAALVLRSLRPYSRIIIAGDSEQLSPILAVKYHQLKSGPLFGSILDTLMYVSRPSRIEPRDTRPSSPVPDDASDMSSQSTIVQLTENFRLNPDLGEFVSTIYSRAFRPQKVQARQIALALSSISQSETPQATNEYLRILDNIRKFLLGLSHVMLKRPQGVLSPPLLSSLNENPQLNEFRPLIDVIPHPLSLALIQLQTVSKRHRENVGYELHVKAEAAVTAALITTIQQHLPGEDIFVATPHRIQRQAVKAALSAGHFNASLSLSKIFNKMTIDEGQGKDQIESSVIVDTIERLQGSEASFVICLFSLPQSHIADLQFLLERRRLNVAISRAKSMCILISSAEVLRPAVGALTDEETTKGYAFLRAFADRAWSSNVKVDIDAL
ncbi:hypothetical protein J3R30DRAFT_3731697 [Lentinula aciculospora]|uniref:AAA+ ATPase domain-containing protein n=1 Tax=Lentinula aciculospora TaxID=153920 RepID=A0A9W9AIK1_9AGAR|nr:hypothetical protein J3R30DRAFT_3731697 [Lentinula aciculospora]